MLPGLLGVNRRLQVLCCAHRRDASVSACRFLKLCGSREELAHLPRGPKLVLAT